MNADDSAALLPPATDAFSLASKYGDQMLCHGILMAMSALAAGLGYQWSWWPLVALGAVLLWAFGLAYLDARRLYNAARREHEREFCTIGESADRSMIASHAFDSLKNANGT